MSFPLNISGPVPESDIVKVHMVFKAQLYAPEVAPQAFALAHFFIDRPMNDQLRAYAAANGIFGVTLTAIPLSGMVQV